MTFEQAGTHATALLAVWTFFAVWGGVAVLLYRTWKFRRVDDGFLDIRLMVLLWAMALLALSFWRILLWLDTPLVGADVLPDQPERWPYPFLLWLFVASSVNYFLVVWWRRRRRDKPLKDES